MKETNGDRRTDEFGMHNMKCDWKYLTIDVSNIYISTHHPPVSLLPTPSLTHTYTHTHTHLRPYLYQVFRIPGL